MRWTLFKRTVVVFIVSLLAAFTFIANRPRSNPLILHTPDIETHTFSFASVNAGNNLRRNDVKKCDCKNEFRKIPCSLRDGDEKRFVCIRDQVNETYIPFNGFLKNQYEAIGSLKKQSSNGEELFEFRQSNVKIIKPSFETYDPKGAYGSFANYNVESRGRVKLISAVDGVPLSVQWASEPYHYPTQIAQFALEHYSKNLTVQSLLPEILHEFPGQWEIEPGSASNQNFSAVFDREINATVIQFDLHEQSPPTLTFYNTGNARKWPMIRLWAKFDKSAPTKPSSERKLYGFCVKVVAKKSNVSERTYRIYYVGTDKLIEVKKPNKIFYGIGTTVNLWRRYTRNIATDFSKGLSFLTSSKTKMAAYAANLRIVSISLMGAGRIYRLSQAAAYHGDQFFDAVDFLLRRQSDVDGGFAVDVGRSVAGGLLQLRPGWRSAMAQGHFLSVACRAYSRTGDEKYRKAALRATRPFDLDVDAGGVRALFLNSTVWYEEYPTTPTGTFVLNGFIYSLIGLYDCWKLCGDEKEARRLYERGLASLKALLPIYDTGMGSLYDLRHVSLNGRVAPNLARWEYHAVHVYQLYWMHAIDGDELFLATARRWENYAKGKRAKHN